MELQLPDPDERTKNNSNVSLVITNLVWEHRSAGGVSQVVHSLLRSSPSWYTQASATWIFRIVFRMDSDNVIPSWTPSQSTSYLDKQRSLPYLIGGERAAKSINGPMTKSPYWFSTLSCLFSVFVLLIDAQQTQRVKPLLVCCWASVET